MSFDINKFKSQPRSTDRYAKRLEALQSRGIETGCIETAVTSAVDNINQKSAKSFVIYGEPQSGKTEMMIALTARLLDNGHKIVIHLLNDSVQLLQQNLERFQRSGLAPSPCNFLDILDPSIVIRKDEERVIFCKKNGKDLKNLIEKIEHIPAKVVIDDEADYASPNTKVNKQEVSRINGLISKLLGTDGVYVGVTATPARLDLNNTFHNDSEKWIHFPPHGKYTGQDVFFPISHEYKFQINLISDGAGDRPEHIRKALFGFFSNAAYLNLNPAKYNAKENNFCFLVHTSGRKDDHSKDYKQIQKAFSVLNDPANKDYESYVKELWNIAKDKFPGNEDDITKYVLAHISRNTTIVMNSDKKDKNGTYKNATSPSALFTVAIGGNIVSRGVTFDNLLGMYFTRDVKHKIQQDTYIQRARMFGSRGEYLNYFELTIPESLYLDWHRCFIFHRLSFEAINSGKGAPVWLEDERIASVASSSIDKLNVNMDYGEMSFGIFDYETQKSKLDAICAKNTSGISKLQELQKLLGEQHLPEYVVKYVEQFCPPGKESIKIHDPQELSDQKGADVENISRKKGFMGGAAFAGDIMHHFRVIYNQKGKARLFYKYSGNIKFLRNMKENTVKEAA